MQWLSLDQPYGRKALGNKRHGKKMSRFLSGRQGAVKSRFLSLLLSLCCGASLQFGRYLLIREFGLEKARIGPCNYLTCLLFGPCFRNKPKALMHDSASLICRKEVGDPSFRDEHAKSCRSSLPRPAKDNMFFPSRSFGLDRLASALRYG
jgi:hypothetical protein